MSDKSLEEPDRLYERTPTVWVDEDSIHVTAGVHLARLRYWAFSNSGATGHSLLLLLFVPFCIAWPYGALGQTSYERRNPVLAGLVKRAEGDASSIPKVLLSYDRIEAQERFEPEDRYFLHRDLLEVIVHHESATIRQVTAELLLDPSEKRYASQVLLLKAIAHDDFPAPRTERVGWLLHFLRDPHTPFSTWVCHLLGDTRWPESIDALIDVMAREEREGRQEGRLWHLARGDLYRILGTLAYSANARAIRTEWDRLGKSIPEQPDYGPMTQSSRRTITAAFFGDRISPRSVFVIDRSGSMRRTVTLKQDGPKSRTSVVEPEVDTGDSEEAAGKDPSEADQTRDAAPLERKIEIVRKELLRAIDRLQASFLFSIVSFDAGYEIWRGSKGRTGRKKRSRTISPSIPPRRSREFKLRDLHRASLENVASAREFTLLLNPGRGTNIYDALRVALGFRSVDTIYLLSDGAPTRGGDIAEIEEHVKVRNYLQGVRIITYGFATERQGRRAEAFLQRLAKNHWGWYRRLNRL